MAQCRHDAMKKCVRASKSYYSILILLLYAPTITPYSYLLHTHTFSTLILLLHTPKDNCMCLQIGEKHFYHFFLEHQTSSGLMLLPLSISFLCSHSLSVTLYVPILFAPTLFAPIFCVPIFYVLTLCSNSLCSHSMLSLYAIILCSHCICNHCMPHCVFPHSPSGIFLSPEPSLQSLCCRAFAAEPSLQSLCCKTFTALRAVSRNVFVLK